MLELKKTTKWDGKLKDIRIVDGKIVDSDGEIVDLMAILSAAYGDMTFNLTMSAKEEETIEISDEDTEDETGFEIE